MFSFLYCSAFFTLRVLAALRNHSKFPFLILVSLVFSCCLVVWFLTFCLVYWITPLAKPSGYCLPIEDQARLLEYSSALPSIYLFCHLFDPACVLTMAINKSLQMDPHASRLVGPITQTCLIVRILNWDDDSYEYVSTFTTANARPQK